MYGNVSKILKNLSDISRTFNKSVRPEIQALAKELESAIRVKDQEILTKCRAALAGSGFRPEIIEIKHVSTLIKKMREEYFPNVSQSTVERALDSKYKMVEKGHDNSGVSTSRVDLTTIKDADIALIKDELKDRIRRIEAGPAKDIKIKASKKNIEEYDWKSPLAYELAKLAIKMEDDYPRHDPTIISHIAKHIRTARDGRFATTLQSYEAMIVACNSTKSLDDVCVGEWEFKNRWEIHDDESHCRECKDRLIECYTKKCKHICHQVVKPMTTKGLKYAIKTDPWLKELDTKMKNTMRDSWKGACQFGRLLLNNPEQKKRLDKSDIKRILAGHILEDKCDQCEAFINDTK